MMRWLCLWMVLLSIGSCQPITPLPVTSWSQQGERPEDVALRLWSYEHPIASPRCAEQVHNAIIRTVDMENLQYRCRQSDVAACMLSYDEREGAVILLADTVEGQSYFVRVHEALHVLIHCSGLGYEGNHHLDEVWRHVPMSLLSADSPWFVERR